MNLNKALAQHIPLEPSPTLSINEHVKESWAKGKEIFHFGFGESRFPVHSKLQDALIQNSHQKAYLPVQGLVELRKAIAAYYSRYLANNYYAEQVIVAPGSKALLFAIQMLLNADLLLPTPSWVSYAPQARLLKKSVYHIPVSTKTAYTLTLKELDTTVKRTSSKYKLLLLNTPNNPTGLILSDPFLADLADYCRDNNIIVLSDEIYALVTHQDQTHKTLASYYPEGTIILGGLSKHLSLGGWRLGLALLPKGQSTLMQALIAVASEIWSSASAPIQYAAITAYSNDPDIEAYIKTCTQLHALRTNYLWQNLISLNIQCPKPQGGFYIMPNFNKWQKQLAKIGVTTSSELAFYLLEHYRIASLPGEHFGLPADNLALRFSSSFIDLESDAQAKKILKHWFSDLSKDALMQNHHPQLRKAIGQLQKFLENLN